MDNKKLMLLISLPVAALIGVVVYYTLAPKSPKEPSSQDFVSAITHNFPEFINDSGDPVIDVGGISAYGEGWYVVTIKSHNQTSNFIPVKLLIHYNRDQEQAFSIHLGPDTRLPDSLVESYIEEVGLQ